MRRRSTTRKLTIAACALCCLAAAGRVHGGEIERIMRSASGAVEMDEPCPAKDLQITVETRFVTVEDKFLEDVGVDFRGLDPDGSTISGMVADDTGPVRNVKVKITAHAVRRVGNPPFQQTFEIGSRTVKSDRQGNYVLAASSLITDAWIENVISGAYQSFVLEARGVGRKKQVKMMSTHVELELIVLPVVNNGF